MPLSCFICHQATSTTLCAQCDANLTVAPIHCRCCLQVLQEENAMCGRCLQEKPFLDGLYVSMTFDDFSRKIILQGKYANDRVALDWMGRSIATLALPSVDEIVPMPISSKRLAHRGFNQTHFLTRSLKKVRYYPVNRYLLTKLERFPQSTLPRKSRKQNIQGAFVVNQKPPARLLLIG
ncbi:ComF family protein [Suttonella ornithocola]|uniref:ComF family protein n=1 Tax=Suttonella ornithocola TaxID=279832 RepID=UPI0011C05871|nr:ComF family protein [Suttonella ornithocola]